jgi:hypothetical protein
LTGLHILKKLLEAPHLLLSKENLNEVWDGIFWRLV